MAIIVRRIAGATADAYVVEVAGAVVLSASPSGAAMRFADALWLAYKAAGVRANVSYVGF